MAGYRPTLGQIWRNAEADTYRLTQQQYAAQEATRREEANALARVRNAQEQPQAMYGSSGLMQGIAPAPKVAAPKQGGLAAPTTGTPAQPTQADTQPIPAAELTNLRISSPNAPAKGGFVSPDDSYYGNPFILAKDKNAMAMLEARERTPQWKETTWDMPQMLRDQIVKTGKGARNFTNTNLYKQLSGWASAAGVDPYIVGAMAFAESGGNQNARSNKGAVGAMQVTEGAYTDAVRMANHKDPSVRALAQTLPKNFADANPTDLAKAGVLYSRWLMDRGVPVNKLPYAYHSGDTSGNLNTRRNDGNITSANHLAKVLYFYNQMNPTAQLEMPEVAGIPMALTPPAAGTQGATGAPANTAQAGGQGMAGLPISTIPTGNASALATPSEPRNAPPQNMQLGTPQGIQTLVNMRNVLANRIQAAQDTGAYDLYAQLATQQAQLDAAIYENLAEMSAAEIAAYNAPQRMLALMSNFSGNNVQAQYRADGKYDLYVNGNKVSGTDGLTPERLSDMGKRMVSQAARSAATAAAVESQKQQTELLKTQLAGIYDLAKARENATALSRSGGVKSLGTTPDGNVVFAKGDDIYYLTPGGTVEIAGEQVATTPQAVRILGTGLSTSPVYGTGLPTTR